MMIRSQGPLRVYSSRSMERSIGNLKKMIRSKVEAGRNASNIVERNALFNYVNTLLGDETAGQSRNNNFRSLPGDDNNGPQLWEPLVRCNLINGNNCIEGVDKNIIFTSLQKYYGRYIHADPATINVEYTVELSGRLWKDSWVYSSIMNRRVTRESRRGNQYVMFTIPYT